MSDPVSISSSLQMGRPSICTNDVLSILPSSLKYEESRVEERHTCREFKELHIELTDIDFIYENDTCRFSQVANISNSGVEILPDLYTHKKT